MPSPRLLYVLRHAKSSWDDQLLADHDRPLSTRGRKALRLIADHVETMEIQPDLVLCSSARRTVDTLRGVFGPDYPAVIEPALYHESCSELVERLRGVSPEVGSVMLIGHNPSLQMLILKLTTPKHTSPIREAPDSPLAQIERKFPTGALAALETEVAWAELAGNTATLVDYIRPKALA